MSGFALFAILAAATGYAEMINRRYLRLPTAMGLVIISLIAVGVVFALDSFGLNASAAVKSVLPTGTEFQEYFINSSLAFMLYAAATSVDMKALRRHALPVIFFASIGVVISVVLVAFGIYWIAQAINLPIDIGVAVLFGAIVAPTDPIAVGRIIATIRGGRTWKAIVSGESLFNDAISLVIFTVVFAAVDHNETMAMSGFTKLFAKEVLIAFGVGIGLTFLLGLTSMFIYSESREGRILLSIGLATGSYSLAHELGGSAPVAVVVAGLTLMWMYRHSPTIKPHEGVVSFWQVIEYCLAAMFFLLIGFEVLAVNWELGFVILAIVAWVSVFIARIITVIIGYIGSALILRLGSAFFFIMPVSLAGVRGALSVALALSLPLTIGKNSENREIILAMTFGTVVIGILLQGAALMAAAPLLNKHQSNRVRLRKPLRSIMASARGLTRHRD